MAGTPSAQESAGRFDGLKNSGEAPRSNEGDPSVATSPDFRKQTDSSADFHTLTFTAPKTLENHFGPSPQKTPIQLRWSLAASARPLTFHPQSATEAAERAMVVKELAAAGLLQQEVADIGVRAEWVTALHRENPYVAISEQLMPLPTLFGKLGKHGGPAVLQSALHRLGEIAQTLQHFSSQQVETGLFASPNHLVSRTSITSGFYFLVPSFTTNEGPKHKSTTERSQTSGAARRDVPGPRRVRLISNNQLSHYDGRPYEDIQIPIAALRQVSNELLKEHGETGRRLRDAVKSHDHQVNKNRRRIPWERAADEDTEGASTQRRRTVSQDDHLTEQSLHRRVKREEMNSLAFEQLRTLWSDSVDQIIHHSPSSDSVKYWDLITDFNTRFSQLIVPSLPFQSVSCHGIDSLATLGVEDWNLFLTTLIETGLIAPNEPILRHRLANGKHEMLLIDDLSHETVRSRETGAVYSIDALVEESRESLASTGSMTLLPIAVMRYWAMYVVGNGIILEDGMPYEKLNRVHQAACSGAITNHPRSLLIDHYTNLNDFQPVNPDAPYAELHERFTTLDFLKPLAQRKA